MKKNIHIEIARTDNPEFSSMNKRSCGLVYDVLKQHYSTVGITTVDSIRDLDALVAKQPDLVFLGMKRVPAIDYADDVWLSAYLTDNEISYTGSPHAAVKLELNKQRAKTVIKRAGLPTAPFFTTVPGQHIDMASLPLAFPLFIKPVHAGGGEGVAADSVVHTFTEFKQKVSSIYTKFRSAALVEQYLTGREFSVAILGNIEDEQLVMPIEISTDQNSNGDRILGWKVKNADSESVSAVSDPVTKRTLITLARSMFLALGAEGIGRIDIRMDAKGNGYFLEANLIPGMSNTGGYFWQAYKLNEKKDYESMILRIAELGLGIEPVMPLNSVAELAVSI